MNRSTKRTSGARLVGLLALLWLGLALIGPAHAGTKHYYYTDAQGTVLAKTDAQGNIIARYDYKPYGAKLPGPQTKGPTGYTGHVNDAETGLVYMQARYYDPVVGRFLSVDPVGPKPGNGFGFNRYDYASNNPINHIDPDGRCPDGMCGEMLKAHVQWRMSHPNAPIDRIEKVGFVGLGAMLTASGLSTIVGLVKSALTVDRALSKTEQLSKDVEQGAKAEDVAQGPRFARGDLRQKVLDKGRQADGSVKCAYCDKPTATQSDHVVPYSKGGTTTIDNLEPACASCNASKGAKDLGTEWVPPKDQLVH